MRDCGRAQSVPPFVRNLSILAPARGGHCERKLGSHPGVCPPGSTCKRTTLRNSPGVTESHHGIRPPVPPKLRSQSPYHPVKDNSTVGEVRLTLSLAAPYNRRLSTCRGKVHSASAL